MKRFPFSQGEGRPYGAIEIVGGEEVNNFSHLSQLQYSFSSQFPITKECEVAFFPQFCSFFLVAFARLFFFVCVY